MFTGSQLKDLIDQIVSSKLQGVLYKVLYIQDAQETVGYHERRKIEYEVGLNGRVTTKGITCNPPNEFLTEQVTEFMKRPPVLSPPIYADGKPRPLTATQPITIVKK